MQRPLLFIQTPIDDNLKNMNKTEVQIEISETFENPLIKSQLNYFMRIHPSFRFLRFILEDGSVIEGTLLRVEEPTLWIEGKNKTFTINGNEIIAIKRIR